LVSSLVTIEGRPWAELHRGRPMTQNSLARYLAPFKVSPDSVRLGEQTRKGYMLTWFDDAFSRYL